MRTTVPRPLIVLSSTILGLLALAYTVQPLQAATIQVTTTKDELTQNGACSLREAISNANADAATYRDCLAGSGADTITLPAGTFLLTLTGANENANATGDLDILGELTLSGAGETKTILDGNATDRVLDAPNASYHVTVQNLSIQHGKTPAPGVPGGGASFSGPATVVKTTFRDNATTGFSFGGGAYFAGSADLTETTFTGNTTDFSGGGATFDQPATLIGATFTGNRADSSGGGAVFRNSAVLTRTTFISNSVGTFPDGNSHDGGGAAFSGPARLVQVTFSKNRAAVEGGGAYFTGDTTLLDTTFTTNTANKCGGGALFAGSATVTKTTFTGNKSYDGGGAYFENTATLIDTTFTNNQAVIRVEADTSTDTTFAATTQSPPVPNGDGGPPTTGGGAHFNRPASLTNTAFISNSANSGGGAYFTDSAELIGTTFDNNLGGEGGGAWFAGFAKVTKTSFRHNLSGQGGGALFIGPAQVTNTTFTDNRTVSPEPYGFGGGASFGYAPYPPQAQQLVNVLFDGNQAVQNGSAIYIYNAEPLTILHSTIVSPTMVTKPAIYINAGTAIISNTIIASHTIGIDVQVGGYANEDYNLFSSVATNINGDSGPDIHSISGPASFVDPAAHNYHLSAGSAAIDQGIDAGISVDFENQLRPYGNGFDIGFDEFVQLDPRLYLTYIQR